MFDYFYENQNEQYLFLQLPLMLIKDDQFKRMSDSSKILYSLLLNRTSLSAKNGWYDEHGRVYIIFTIEEIMEDLNCAKEKASKLLKELKDIGLIETIRRGLGLPNLIFVKNFATSLRYEPKNPKTLLESLKFENRTSVSSKIKLQQVRKSNSSNINSSNINFRKIESSQRQTAIDENSEKTVTMTLDIIKKEKENEKTDTSNSLQSLRSISSPIYDYKTYQSMIRANIDYTHYLQYQRDEIENIDELIECMLDVICTSGDTVKISGEEKNRQMVISQYMKITSKEIDHILMKYKEQYHRITRTNNYLKTMLYTVRQEMGHHYINAVRTDGII